ncbi:hypothetical protein Tco_0880430 [Tanacetum coccineum]
MECLVTWFMVMILREFGVNPLRIKVRNVEILEMDGMWSIYGVRTQGIRGYGGGSWWREFLFIPDTAITKAGTKLLHRAYFSYSWDTLGISTLKAIAAYT